MDRGDSGIMKKILVTGGSGFVGLTVMKELSESGQEVIATTKSNPREQKIFKNVKWIHWDCFNDNLPAVEWDELKTILHLAVSNEGFDFPEKAAILYELTVAAQFRLLEKANQYSGIHFISASTGDVVGVRKHPVQNSDNRYDPSSFYGATKACAEILQRAYEAVIPSTSLRIYHPYGPGGDRFLVNKLLRKVLDNEQLVVDGNEGIMLNPIWIDELAVCIRLAIEGRKSGIFNFAGPETVSLRHLITTMGKLSGKSVDIVKGKSMKDSWHHSADNSQIKDNIGYEPQIGVEEGITKLVEFSGTELV